MPGPLFKRPGALKVALVAGEASGDLLGAHLMAALKARHPDIEFAGIGGPRMLAQGINSVVPQERLAVRGYAEVLSRLPELLRIRRRLRDALLRQRPDVFVGIDAPDFNLGLEKALKQRGVRTVHYVSPSVWAWRPERVQKIGDAADRVLCLFPMEPPLYEAAGVPVTFVGHPLASEIPLEPKPAQMRERLSLPAHAPVFALMPGSRVSEIDYMGELFVETARRLVARYPDAQFLVPLATRATLDAFDKVLTRQKAWDLPIRKLFGHAQMAMVASDVALVKSGTSTLEVALTKTPMVITYKLSWLTYRLVKRKLKLPWVGLPNILLGDSVVPELLQYDATPDKLAEAVAALYDDETAKKALVARFTALHESLRQDTAGLAADAVLAVAKC
ncbi:lipid-A-disaccharide synthase [Crenobacter luteus]|uniref:Lipid-A-disaccharide synthase n=1 Tax=Crenobacter luteus TaxID=1452487 RepID=A0A163DLB5_9NEIS|nr:lipid-A-disaccharide synthase [Crenobacter luteus]KZE34907.1 lipid-A-disaccharide synthase [Crenobacter luteus]